MGHARKHRIRSPAPSVSSARTARYSKRPLPTGISSFNVPLSRRMCKQPRSPASSTLHRNAFGLSCIPWYWKPSQWELASQREPDSSCSYGLNAVRQKEALM
jgi:hypothetical protein